MLKSLKSAIDMSGFHHFGIMTFFVILCGCRCIHKGSNETWEEYTPETNGDSNICLLSELKPVEGSDSPVIRVISCQHCHNVSNRGNIPTPERPVAPEDPPGTLTSEPGWHVAQDG